MTDFDLHELTQSPSEQSRSVMAGRMDRRFTGFLASATRFSVVGVVVLLAAFVSHGHASTASPGSLLDIPSSSRISSVQSVAIDQPGCVVITAGREVYCASRQDGIRSGWPKSMAGSVAGIATTLGDAGAAILACDVQGNVEAWDLAGNPLSHWSKKINSTVTASPVTADWNDGVLVVPDWSGKVWCWDSDGALRRGWPVELEGRILSSVTPIRTEGGSSAILVATDQGWLSALDATGKELRGYPVDLGAALIASPTVGDVTGRGEDEICLGGTDGKVWLLNRSGDVLPGWPVELHAPVGTTPALGDVNGDGQTDVIVATRKGTVAAFDGAGRLLDGWPKTIEGMILSSPVLPQMDEAPGLEVIVAGQSGWAHAWNGSGEALEGWPKWLGIPNRLSPTLVSTEDGSAPELAIAAQGGIIYATASRDNSSTQPVMTPEEELAPVAKTTLPSQLAIRLSPNPARISAEYSIVLAVPSAGVGASELAKVELYNVAGRHVATVFEGALAPGEHIVFWQPTVALSSGVYLVRAIAAGQSTTAKVLILQ